ncbi:MAG: chemotaxis protein CheA, partial [Zoogloea sp.]|nr:chemotaxis protein CheA [Zoogloea sp.]
MNLDDALNTFIVEARELLEQMEEALLQVEQAPDDPEAIAAIFRAAHTIKGSAGLFGLDHVVSFTHVAESVLDKVRNAELAIDSTLVALFLSVCDQIGVLIDHVAESRLPDEAIIRACDALAGRLRAYLGDARQAVAPAESASAATAPHAGCSGEEVDTDRWHLSLRFGRGVLQNGMDPLAFIRYITTFGRIVHIVTLTDGVPALSGLDAEAFHLGFEIGFETAADKATIEGAFEFVRDDADICILPPHSKISEYLELIEHLPEEEMRLGEILVRCGTLTRAELDGALSRQSAQPQGQHRPLGETLVAEKRVQPQVVEAALDKQKQVKDHKSGESGLIRVNAEKLDQHINLIGELIIASAGIGLNAQHQHLPELQEAASLLARLVEEIRDSALQLRMVAIGATFNKFQRVVHDVSQELGKDIRLEISGADTELDKTVVEKIGDPLTHLVRNSMDHGIEPVELRLARGKPAHGTLRLNAYHDAGSIVIEVSDDGGGLDRERILRKAIERGLVKPDQTLSDNEVHQLIFEAGLSTAEQVNNLSGRGVGMDVVRRNISALRGSIDILSEPGVGTTIRIRLPLTLAIIDGFLVAVGASSFVVPLDMVVECVELGPENTEGGGQYLDLRGEVLPLIRLKTLFDVPAPPPAAIEDDDPFAAGGAGKAAPVAVDPELAFLLEAVKRDNVVVVQYAGHRA